MQSFNSMTAFAVLTASLFTGAAFGAEIGTIGDLSRIQAETVLIKAKAKREEARSELNAKSGTAADGDATLPVVGRIINSEITFFYPNKVMVPARVGDEIPGGFKVAAINEASRAVSLRKGNQTHVIGFAASAPAAAKAERGAGMPGMPLMNMMPPIR